MQFRKAVGELRAIWVMGNEYMTVAAPWKVIKEDRERAAMIVRTGLQLIRLFAILSWPIIPSTSAKVLKSLGDDSGMPHWPGSPVSDELEKLEPGRNLDEIDILFTKISPEEVESLEQEFGGAED
jgi:methionyl-tRNA synthetase